MPMPKKAEILERATELYMKDQARCDGALGSTTPEMTELKEGGYWQQAIEELRSPDAVAIDLQKVDKNFLIWTEQVYGDYDAIRDREMMKACQAQNMDFLNCLVLSFSTRHYGLAVKILTAKYKRNLMQRTQRILKANAHSTMKIRVLWFIGTKQQTTAILDDLREKHNINPRVLRDSYLRRDRVHYANGTIYKMSKRTFEHLRQKQSVILQEEEANKILAPLIRQPKQKP
jgi:hypothetical protein